MKRVYLDNNATTRLRQEVFDAMTPWLTEHFGNASSIHQFGRVARKAIDEAREKVRGLISAKSADEIIFTSGGTESDNFAIKGVAHALRSKGNHIITSSIEHHAVLNTCKFLEKEGFQVTYLPVDGQGIVDCAALKRSITNKTILISIMTANNEVGTIEPLEEILAIAKERGVLVHTDAVQAIGKIPLDVAGLPVDLVSLSGHKIHGPKGVGALYIKKKTPLTPLLHGGHHEMNKRAGTENVAGIVGIGTAAALAKTELKTAPGQVQRLRDRLEREIREKIGDIRLHGHPEKRLPNTLSVSFRYLEGESIILNLDLEGVAVSTGSACTSGSLEPSHVLISMGVDPVDSQGSIRFSLSAFNTDDDIDYVMKVLPPIIQRLREMSPLYNK